MRIVILGAGSLGLLFAGHLARAGSDVVLVARPAAAQHIREHGVTVRGPRSFTTPVRVTERPEQLGTADVLIVTVKNGDTDAALASLGQFRAGLAASLQNGIVKDERLRQRFGMGAVVGAATAIGATRTGLGEVLHTLEAMTYFGELDGRPSDRVARLVAEIARTGLPAIQHDDLPSVEWSKACQYCAAGLTSAVSRLEYYKVCLNRDLATLFVNVTREVASVARAEGVEVQSYPDFEVRALVDPPFEEAVGAVIARGKDLERRGVIQMRISMCQDILAGRRTEAEEVVGPILERAARHGVPAPTTEFALRVVRGVQSYF